MKRILILISLIVFSSCNNTIKVYDSQGVLIKEYTLNDDEKIEGIYKEYNSNGSLKLLHHYDSGNLVDSSLYYKNGYLNQIKYWNTLQGKHYFEKVLDKNGSLESSGRRLKNGIRVGKWSFFIDGLKQSEIEYVTYNKKEYTNQIFIFKDNDTLFDEGNFYQMNTIKDTLYVDEEFQLYFFLRNAAISNESSFKMILPKYREGVNFNNDFSNVHQIPRDTVLSLNNYIDENGKGLNHITTSMMRFKKPGVVKLRIILNEYIEYEGREDNLKQEERLIFFEKEIYVKNTPPSS